MNFTNATKMLASYTLGMNPDGKESIVVVVKGTFTIPPKGEISRLADKQFPFVEADQFTGEPGVSAILYESDYAPIKPRCDVILNGSAYSNNNRWVRELQVGFQLKSINKSFRVIGNRLWKQNMVSFYPSDPEPFIKIPLSYDIAFGGIDTASTKPDQQKFFTSNPAGKGFFDNNNYALMEGKPLPNTEEFNNPIRKPNGSYKPMAFGVVGRGWYPRYTLAGTYDQNWLDNEFPFLPKDFNPAYYQSAPADQQTDYLKGGETVTLKNLTPEGLTSFNIPQIEVPVLYQYKDNTEKEVQAVIDTVYIEPDQNRFIIIWRSSMPLKKNIFEFEAIIAGKMPKSWYRAKNSGKTYYRSLKDLIEAKSE